MPLDLEREYTVTHSRVLDKDVFYLVAQKSKDQVVEIMQKYGDDRIGFRNAMFDDIFIFIKGCAVIKAYKEDVEAIQHPPTIGHIIKVKGHCKGMGETPLKICLCFTGTTVRGCC